LISPVFPEAPNFKLHASEATDCTQEIVVTLESEYVSAILLLISFLM
jgi:hypothetical protein